MPDIKVSELSLIAEVSDDDELYIVDKNVYTDGASGTSRKVKKRDLVGARRVSLGTISIVEGVDTAGTFEWTGIPQNFNRLLIKGYLRSTAASTADVLYINYNGDTNVTNYKWLYQQTVATADNAATNSAGGAASFNVPDIARIIGPAAGVEASAFTRLDYTLEGYNIPNPQICRTLTYNRRSASIIGMIEEYTTWITAQAVTSILLKTDGGEGMYGKLTLYAEE